LIGVNTGSRYKAGLSYVVDLSSPLVVDFLRGWNPPDASSDICGVSDVQSQRCR
jgi:hypothetical protein